MQLPMLQKENKKRYIAQIRTCVHKEKNKGPNEYLLAALFK